MKQLLELSRDVLQKSKDTFWRMFVPENIEYESFIGYEGVAIPRHPFFSGRRKHLSKTETIGQKNLL
jgi:hypothetical protein